MKVDLHVHSWVSKCSLNPIFILRKKCKKLGITPAICDHNKLTKLDFAIPGEEIATNKGEFIGLFIEEEIPKGLDLFEAMDRVKEQSGLIILPHPFDYKRKRSLAKFNVVEDKEFLKRVDIVEVFNSRCRDLTPNIMALEYAKKHKFAVSFGSDAHFPWELGNVYIKLDINEIEPKTLLKGLKEVSKYLFNYQDIYTNPWKSKYFFGKLGNCKNIELYSKILKNIRNLRFSF
ncbi:PHP domain-containing protein [Methanocaldococcus indicus]|uniref:PHP domain-containing protein n=1 Tax=Methanocaldococcus indicus TaxID=213231 RepID=UPI003C6CF476